MWREGRSGVARYEVSKKSLCWMRTRSSSEPFVKSTSALGRGLKEDAADGGEELARRGLRSPASVEETAEEVEGIGRDWKEDDEDDVEDVEEDGFTEE